MENTRKAIIWVIILIVLLVLAALALIFFIAPENTEYHQKYSCSSSSNCVSQCSNGCVTSSWAELNPDTTECLRAWDCSCVRNKCYTDGKPPKI